MTTMVNSSIARDIWPITKHATDPVGGSGSVKKAYGVRVEGAGDLVCRTEGGIADVTIALAAGETLPVVITHVRATSTATGLFGYSLYTPAA
jgi:hypothetical protein